MNYDRTRTVLGIILMSFLSACGAVFVSGQGGTGREKPKPPTPPKRNPPASGQASCSARSPTQSTGRKHTVDLSAGVRLEMVEIPSGSFCMGSANEFRDSRPVHRVTIDSFYIGRYEVTQAQWLAIMGNNPSKYVGDTLPVESTSWNDAQEFINKLNERKKGLDDLIVGYLYRLPTEAEWEYAARAGTSGAYAGKIDEMAWYEKNSGTRPHPVGQKLPNAFGLFDMHGNVWEWCEDWSHDNYNGAPKDGRAWLSGGDRLSKVFRGGSWDGLTTSAGRGWTNSLMHSNHIGLRVVAIVPSEIRLRLRPNRE